MVLLLKVTIILRYRQLHSALFLMIRSVKQYFSELRHINCFRTLHTVLEFIYWSSENKTPKLGDHHHYNNWNNNKIAIHQEHTHPSGFFNKKPSAAGIYFI